MRDWQQRLDAFGKAHASFVDNIDCMVQAMETEHLRQLLVDCDQPTRTNSWCHTWQVIPFLRDALKSELGDRDRDPCHPFYTGPTAEVMERVFRRTATMPRED